MIDDISIVIPAYNEEQRIGSTLKSYWEFLSKNYKKLEIIVVADGVTDRTPAIVSEFAKGHARVRLLSFSNRLGKGGGVLEGFKAAKGKYIGFTDADESVEPREFNKLIRDMEDYDCVIGSRYAKGAIVKKSEPKSVVFASRVFNLIVNLLFNLGIKDTQCGAKMFRAEALKKVIPKMITRDFSFDVELLWRVSKIGRIKEEPLIWEHKQQQSKSTLKNAPKLLISIIKVRLHG